MRTFTSPSPVKTSPRFIDYQRDGKMDMTPTPVIVWFTNLRTRDAIYRTRLALKARPGLYINERLTKSTAALISRRPHIGKTKAPTQCLDNKRCDVHQGIKRPFRSTGQGGNSRRAAERCFMNMHTLHFVLLLGRMLSFQVIIICDAS